MTEASVIACVVLLNVNNLLDNEDLVCVEWVAVLFAALGLECKQPGRVVNGVRLL